MRSLLHCMLFMACCLVKAAGSIPKDSNIYLKWSNTNNEQRHLCLNADGLSMSDGKKLMTFVGNCCGYPKFFWSRATSIISSQDKSVCIEKASASSDVKFTNKPDDCATFKLSEGSLLERTDAHGICIHPDMSNGQHIYKNCNEITEFQYAIAGATCSAVTDTTKNMGQYFYFSLHKYCWIPESFSEGKVLKDSNDQPCCDLYRFVHKSDRTIFVKSTTEAGEFCVQVDGMPYNLHSELDTRKPKLSRDCKGSAFVYDAEFHLLRVEGTDRCLFRSGSDDITVNRCDATSSYTYSYGICSDTNTFTTVPTTTVTSELTRTSIEKTPPSTTSILSTTSSATISLVSTMMTPSVSTMMTPSVSTMMTPSVSTMMTSSARATTSSFSNIGAKITSIDSNTGMSPVNKLMTSSGSSVSTSLANTTASISRPSSLFLPEMVINISLPLTNTSTLMEMTLLPTGRSVTPTATVQVLPFQPFYEGVPIDGNWSQWTTWSSCSVNCGSGVQERIRYCDNPAPRNGGLECVGGTKETLACTFSKCSGAGMATDTQSCLDYCHNLGLQCDSAIFTGNSILPFLGANFTCSSDDSCKVWTESYEPAIHLNDNRCCGYIKIPSFVSCDAKPPNGIRRLCQCYSKDDAGYFPWTPWSSCSRTCGGGSKSRARMCLNYTMAAQVCRGSSSETVKCNTVNCPVAGGFAHWSAWTSCSSSCGGGTRTRNRTCSNPYPAYGGALCYGKYIEHESCRLWYCPVNGGWTSWGSWEHCNKPCNNGTVTRRRACANPVPMYSGQRCQGDSEQSILCNSRHCPNVTLRVQNVAFDVSWQSEYEDWNGIAFYNFQQRIQSNTEKMMRYGFLGTFQMTQLHSLRQGSVIASFTLFFNALDSYQALFLMDSINEDYFLGKMPIVRGQTANFSSTVVPSSPPANVTGVSSGANSIDVSWDEVPPLDQNGVITGYLVFYRESSAINYTTAAAMQLNITISGLAAATTYALRVLAYNANGNGVASDLMMIRTDEKAPTLPPQSISVVPMSAFSLFVEWTHPPTSSWNGIIAGYKIDIKSEDGKYTKSISVDGAVVNTNIAGLSPASLYVVDVCAFTSAGTGPCIRSFNKTFVSTPSMAPPNALCRNRTSTGSIHVDYDVVPIAFIHGVLKGYRIEYRLVSVGPELRPHSPVQAVTVGPFHSRATLQNLEANSVYEIRVMAVNEHGPGLKSPPLYGETCSCPEVIYTNYATKEPYIYYDAKGYMKGIFSILLHNITSSVCGSCNGRKSRIDYFNDGKNGWSDKRNSLQVTRAIDDFVHISFAIPGSQELPVVLGKPYIPLVAHPGMILFTTMPTQGEQVNSMLNALFRIWPIFATNLAFILVAGIIFWALTFKDTPKYNCCSFFSGSLRGSYWAYVTIFTHGYGDITPNTVASRLFAVVWILIGLVTSAILIGGMSTALTTASVLPDVTLYRTTLASLDGSKERLVGIYRNAIVTPEAKYETIEAVYRALKDRKVEAALVDAYVVASRPDLFTDKAIIARKMIQYSYTYGVVLSGAMENTRANVRSYVSEIRQYIAHMIEETTPKFAVNSKVENPASLFDPSSQFLRLTLAVLTGMLLLLLVAGWVYNCCRKHSAKCRGRGKDPTEALFKAAENGIHSDLDSLYKRIAMKEEEHSKRLLKVKRRKRGHVHPTMSTAILNGSHGQANGGGTDVVLPFNKDERLMRRLDLLLSEEAKKSRK